MKNVFVFSLTVTVTENRGFALTDLGVVVFKISEVFHVGAFSGLDLTGTIGFHHVLQSRLHLQSHKADVNQICNKFFNCRTSLDFKTLL